MDPHSMAGAPAMMGVLPVHASSTSGNPVTHDPDDPEEPLPYVDPAMDTGSGSFTGIPVDQISINMTDDGNYAVQAKSGQVTAVTVSEVVITAPPGPGPITTVPSTSIAYSVGNGYTESVGPAFDPQAASGGTTVSEVVVTAPRYDPCLGLQFNMSKLSATSGEAVIEKDTQGEFAAQLFQQTDPDHLVIPDGYALQNKLVLYDALGRPEIVEVLQQIGHSNYVIAAQGASSPGEQIEALGNIVGAVSLTPNAQEFATQSLNFIASVGATIHANDPGAMVYLSGHSYAAAIAIVGTEVLAQQGIPISQIHTVALAPVTAGAIFDYQGLSRYGDFTNSITTYINLGDAALPFMGTSFYGTVIINDATVNSRMNPDGTFSPSVEDHGVCGYVKSIGRP